MPEALAAGLPSPATLRQTSDFSQYPRFRLANDYFPDGTLRTVPGLSFGQRIFQPDYPPGGEGAGPAWAMYALDLTGYSGAAELDLDWDIAPAAADLFIAVGDFPGKRWKWITTSDTGVVTVPLGADNLNAGNFYYVAVLLTGESEAVLNWLRMGGNVPPVVNLKAMPAAGFGFLTTDLVAAAEDPEGSPLTFEFDVLGDGNFVDNGTSNTLQDVMYDAIQVFRPAVRVSDADGGVTEVDTEIGIGYVRSFGGAGFDSANAVAVGPNNEAILTGNANSFGAGNDEPFLLALNKVGNPVTKWSVGTASGDEGYDISINSQGAILVAGSVYNGSDHDAFAFEVSPMGSIAWQKKWGDSSDENQTHGFIREDGSALLGCPQSIASDQGILLSEFDSTGAAIGHHFVSGDGDMNQVRLRPAAEGDFYLVGNLVDNSAFTEHVVAIRFNSDFSVQWAKELQVVNAFRLGRICVADDNLYFCGSLNYELPGDTGSCFFKVSPAGELLMQKRLEFSDKDSWYGITTEPGTGDILLCGATLNQNPVDLTLCGAIARYSPAGKLSYVTAYNQPMFNNSFSDIVANPEGGFYICGTTQDNSGVFYEPFHLEHDVSFPWVDFSPAVVEALVSVTDFGATRADITTAVFDIGGGNADVGIMLWFQP